MQHLQHPILDRILRYPEPDDPVDEPGADLALEAMLNGPVPPEAWKDPDELAAELFLGSVEFAAASVPEPPEMPALALAA